ncbi:MAG: glycosyltransferase family 2 protein [Mangrovibacterium sp.]|nr:glycosyltransferase family 2 protein [Mangrovibacterium sp.]
MAPTIAIVILNWNGEKLLPRFLPSVISNSRQEGVKIIVADNGSSDLSLQLLRTGFPEVEILDLGDNHGFARGYNEALRQIDADYYILLNSDVEVTPGWITPLISLMENDPAIAAVQPKIKNWQKRDEFEYAGAAGGFIDKLGFPFCRGRILNVHEKDEGQYDGISPVFWASGACMTVRAEAFRKAGGFDPDFWAHMEEIDLCWRLKNTGYQVMYTHLSTVYHLGGGSLPYHSPRKLYLNFRNSLFLLYKNLPANKLFKVMTLRMFLDGAAAMKFLIGGNPRGFMSVWNAHLSYYRALPVLKKKRKQLMELSTPKWHEEILCKSIIWKFYIQKKRKFGELNGYKKAPHSAGL